MDKTRIKDFGLWTLQNEAVSLCARARSKQRDISRNRHHVNCAQRIGLAKPVTGSSVCHTPREDLWAPQLCGEQQELQRLHRELCKYARYDDALVGRKCASWNVAETACESSSSHTPAVLLGVCRRLGWCVRAI